MNHDTEPTDWETKAARISNELSELQQDAPLDAAGFLETAENNLNFALMKYRTNRSEDQEQENAENE
jgi:hypothetical protein